MTINEIEQAISKLPHRKELPVIIKGKPIPVGHLHPGFINRMRVNNARYLNVEIWKSTFPLKEKIRLNDMLFAKLN